MGEAEKISGETGSIWRRIARLRAQPRTGASGTPQAGAPQAFQPAQFRLALVSFLAAGIGLVAGLVAYVLYKLIGLFTNLFFFHRWSTGFTSVRFHTLGPWVILVPVIGGLVVVLPLMLVAVIADGIAMLFMPNSSIMTEKLARRGLRVHQDYEADALTQATVGETMEKDAPVIAADTKVGALAERIARHDPGVARHEALLILNAAGKLAGIITRGDVLRALDKDSSGAMTVQEAGHTHLVVTYPDELVSEAAAKLLRFNIGRLPVVDRSDERRVVGYLGRAAILAARLRRFHDEHVVEPGWLAAST